MEGNGNNGKYNSNYKGLYTIYSVLLIQYIETDNGRFFTNYLLHIFNFAKVLTDLKVRGT
jgi:hypothetical protein